MDRRRNNVLTSWVHAAANFGFKLARGHAPRTRRATGTARLGEAQAREVEFGEDPEAAVAGADCVVSDAWVSMGDEDATKRHNLLQAYQVNGA